MSPHVQQYLFNTLEAASICAGGGGSSIGAKMAGLRVIGAVDICPHALKTHELNDSECKAVKFDLLKEKMDVLNKESIRKAGELAHAMGVKDCSTWDGLLLFTAPCTGYSYSGRGLPSNPINRLVLTMLPLLEAMPKASLLFENVPGFCRDRFQDIHKELFDGIEKVRGIRLHPQTLLNRYKLNSADYGVPQQRKRILFPLRTDGIMPPKPSPQCLGVRTLRDTIHPASGFADPDPRRPKLSKYVTRLIENMRYGDTPRVLAARDPWVMQVAQRKRWEQKQMMDSKSLFRLHHWDMPAQTLVTQGSYKFSEMPPMTPDKQEFSIGERMRIQGFPLDYKFDGKLDDIITLIGNAVPPPMFAAAIRSYFSR